jgi:class 3 adenylate cyclase
VNLNPSEIMQALSIIFANFDFICEKYELITQIKLIGDTYMAAWGIFHQDVDPVSHASQVVRVGVNTDGPLIAGVLGTDKPIFDIIGDPINVSARLQSTGIPNQIQISEKYL